MPTVPADKSKSRPRTSRTWYAKFLYIVFNNGFRLLWMVYLRLRVFRSDRFPDRGAALICSNHQSHLDPILVANACSKRYISFVARESLFRFRPFGWLIRTFGAFPINRDAGLGGIKTTLKKLKNGEMVLIFPEGTRTPDGQLKEFKSGFCAIARRGRVPIIPLAIEGAYEAWPRSSRIPGMGRVRIKTGEPIPVEKIAELSDEALTSLVQQAVAQLQSELNAEH